MHIYHIHPMDVVQQKDTDTTVKKCHQFVGLIYTKVCVLDETFQMKHCYMKNQNKYRRQKIHTNCTSIEWMVCNVGAHTINSEWCKGFFKKGDERMLILANANNNLTQWHYVSVYQLSVSHECWTLWSPNIVQIHRSFLENEAVVTSHIL